MKKPALKMLVDLAMTILLLGQMGYHMMDNQMHEWTGAALLILFVAHHALNIGWHRALVRGRYTPRRILLTVTDILLTITMLTVAVSAVLVSRNVFDFLGLHLRAIGRRIHMPATMWLFVFMGAHLGLHMQAMLSALCRKFPWMQTKAAVWLWRIAALTVIGYGAVAFVARELYMEMFMLREFAFLDYGESPIFFFAEYAAITLAWALIFHGLSCALKRLKPKKREEL